MDPAPSITYRTPRAARTPRRSSWGVTSLALAVAQPVGYLLVPHSIFAPSVPHTAILALILAAVAVAVTGFICGVVAVRGPNRVRALAVVGLILNAIYAVSGGGAAAYFLLG
jgi:hypothetical protein